MGIGVGFPGYSWICDGEDSEPACMKVVGFESADPTVERERERDLEVSVFCVLFTVESDPWQISVAC